MAVNGEKNIRRWYEVFSVTCALAAGFMAWMGIRAFFDQYAENPIMATFGPIVAAFAVFATLVYSARVVIKFWEFQWGEKYKKRPARRFGNMVVLGLILLIISLSSYYNIIGISADEARRLEQNAYIQRKHAEFEAVNDTFAIQENLYAYLSTIHGQIKARHQHETSTASGGPGSVSTKLERLVSDVGGLVASLEDARKGYNNHREKIDATLISLTKTANAHISLTERDSQISGFAASFNTELVAMRGAIRLDPIKQLVLTSRAFELGALEAGFTSAQKESFQKHQEQASEYGRVLKEKVSGIQSEHKWASPEPYIALTDAQAVGRRLSEMPFAIAFGTAIDIVPLLLGLLLGYMSVRTKEKRQNAAKWKGATKKPSKQTTRQPWGRIIDFPQKRKETGPSGTVSPESA